MPCQLSPAWEPMIPLHTALGGSDGGQTVPPHPPSFKDQRLGGAAGGSGRSLTLLLPPSGLPTPPPQAGNLTPVAHLLPSCLSSCPWRLLGPAAAEP